MLIQDYFLKTIKSQTQTSNDDIDIDPNGTGKLNIITTAQATVGSAGSVAVPVNQQHIGLKSTEQHT